LPLPGTAVLPESPFAASAPRLSAYIPLIIGCTRDEFGSFPLLGDTHFQSADQFPLSEADLRAELVKTWSDKADAVLAAAKTDFAGEKPATFRNIMNSIFFRQGALTNSASSTKPVAAIFSYYFVWQTPLLDGSPGAFHTQDLYFWFDNIARNENATGNTPEAQRISAAMSDSLVAFLRTGSPSTPALPWPAYTPSGRERERTPIVAAVHSDLCAPLASAGRLAPAPAGL
jgi:para-nitrobenzyl esterase